MRCDLSHRAVDAGIPPAFFHQAGIFQGDGCLGCNGFNPGAFLLRPFFVAAQADLSNNFIT